MLRGRSGAPATGALALALVLALGGCGGSGHGRARSGSSTTAVTPLTPAQEKVSDVKHLATPNETVEGNSVSFLNCMNAGYRKHGVDPAAGRMGSPALDAQLIAQCTASTTTTGTTTDTTGTSATATSP